MSDEKQPPEGVKLNPNKPERCLGCPLYDEPGPVWGAGPTDAKLMVVGEAPGSHEVAVSKRPFTGGSGKVEQKLFYDSGMSWERSYRTNVVKCRPTAVGVRGELVDRPPTKTEMTYCAPFLAEELEKVKPNLVLALGATALYVFKDRNEIGKWRGQCFSIASGQKVLATYHPAGLMRQQHLFPLVVEDHKKAKLEMEFPEVRRAEVSYRTFGPGGGDLEALLADARAAHHIVGDLETTGLAGRYDTILCAGFGTADRKADCYAWDSRVEEFVRKVFADRTIEFIGQYSESFDLEFLRDKGIPYPVGPHFDTFEAGHLINPDLPKDLGTHGSVYTDREYWKWKGKRAKSLSETMEYCCEDIDGTRRTYVTQKKELQMLGLEGLFQTVMRLQPYLRQMSRLGMRKDEAVAARWSIALTDMADRKEKMLQEGLNQPFFNINSPKQLIKLFYEDLGLPKQYTRDKNKGMRLTANAAAMEKLAEITNDPIFKLVNDIRSLRKYDSTYCQVGTDENGFIHPYFGTGTAGNGRLNSRDPNAQNWPHEMREMLVADTEDHVIISADWSQVEWRVEMALSGDLTGNDMFATGRDIHRTAAVGFAGVPYDKVTDDIRHQMKFIVYGLLYGRQIKSIAVQTGLLEDVVTKLVAGFFKTFPGVQDHLRIITEFARKNSYLRNPFARRRWWYGRGQETEQYNFLPSSTAADMMYEVIPTCAEQMPDGATLRLTVHDELVAVSPKDSKTLRLATECIRDNMQRKFPIIGEASLRPEVIKKYYPQGWWAPVEVSYGNNWKQCKSKTKEDKLWQKEFQKTLGIVV